MQGWLQLKTGKGKLQFLRVRDGTGVGQAVVFRGNVSPEVFEAAKRLPLESSLILTGTVRADAARAGLSRRLRDRRDRPEGGAGVRRNSRSRPRNTASSS